VSFGAQQRQEIAKLQIPGSNACVICGKYNFNDYNIFTNIFIYKYLYTYILKKVYIESGQATWNQEGLFI